MSATANGDNTAATKVGGFSLERLGVIIGVGLALVVFTLRVLNYDFVSDDAFIVLRYARNLVNGNGLVFNPGEYVEGFTSPLWTFLIAGGGALGIDYLMLARALGYFFSVLSLIVLALLVWELEPNKKRAAPLAVLATLLLALEPSFASWAAAGLETTLFTFAVLVCLYAAAREANLFWLSVLSIVLWLTRPEGVLIIPLLAYHLYSSKQRESATRYLTVQLAALVIMIAVRFWYYAAPLPNTFYAKTGGGVTQWVRGLEYVLDYARSNIGILLCYLPALYFALAGDQKKRLVAFCALAFSAATIYEGGDGLPMYRFMLAAAPLFIVLLVCFGAQLIESMAAKIPTQLRLLPIAFCAIALLYSFFKFDFRNPRYINLEYQRSDEIPRWRLVGEWLKNNTPADARLAAVPIGAIGYYSQRPILDLMGLTDLHIARGAVKDLAHGMMGHLKHDGDYVISQKPDILLLGNVYVTSEARAADDPDFNPMAYNAQIKMREGGILSNPNFGELYEPASVRLDSQHFLNCYILKSALVRWGWRKSS